MKLLEPISRSLLPYKDLVGATAAIITVGQFFAGAFMCNDIRKRGSSKGFPVIPLLGGVVLCAISIQFGQQIQDGNMIKVNLIGFALSVIYCMIYYHYTPNPDKMKVWGQFGIAGALIIGILAYAQYEDPKLVEFRFGLIVTAVLFALVGSPLLDLPAIMERKSTEGLPFPIIFSGTLVSISWLTYGVTLNNDFMILQNLACTVMCAVQLSLFAIYPTTPSKKDGGKKKTN